MEPNKNNNRKRSSFSSIIIIIIIAIIGVIVFNTIFSSIKASRRNEISYDEFLTIIESGDVAEVVVIADDYTIEVTKKSEEGLDNQPVYYTGIMNDPDLVNRLEQSGVKYREEIPDSSNAIVSMLISTVLPFVIIYGILFFLFRQIGKNSSGIMGVGKANAKVYVQKHTGVTFRDVAGQEEAKESLKEIVDFLHNPGKYTRIGAKLPKGALLIGPPGTGKTLLARAVAGEAKVPFYSITGSDFVEMYVGVGASRVRDLFKQATQAAPCIVFIDELDAIGKSRDARFGGNDEREQTLNQLLSEMDGFDPAKGVIILAATNRPEILDKALLRPGRFDRRIIVEKPDLKGRVDTLKVHARNVNMDETVDFNEIALATAGAVGSDLANIINEAALNAVKHGRNAVSQTDLFESVETVIAGMAKKDRVLTEKERRTVAYHEVGHALMTTLQKGAEPVQKITIIPRTMGALGYTMQVPEEEKHLMSKEEMEAELVMLYGGRAAEEVKFGTITTGASNDIERATKIARSMVTVYGMTEKFGLITLETVQDQYLDSHFVKNMSDETASEVDHEIMRILKAAYSTAVRLLRENMECLDRIAEYLLEQETITGKQFMTIFNRAKEQQARIAMRDAEEAKAKAEAEGEAESAADAPAGTQDVQTQTGTDERKDI